jgi:hypothetical protein
LESGPDRCHSSLRYILDYPRPLLARRPLPRADAPTWITDSVLCSAAREGGHVPAAVRRCAEAYLLKHLALLPHAAVIALGRKAQACVARLRIQAIPAASVAPPGCFRRDVRRSSDEAAALARRRMVCPALRDERSRFSEPPYSKIQP